MSDEVEGKAAVADPADNVVPMMPSTAVELCGRCPHQLDHRGRQCQHEAPPGIPGARCPCPSGIRTDQLMCVQLDQIIGMLNVMNVNAFKHLLLNQAISGMEVEIVPMPDGNTEVRVKPINKTGGLVMPGH